MDPRNPPQVLVHFYRASVQHADVWRQRLDATTNWAVITTAAVITFSFGSPRTEDFVVLVALVFDFFFLFMEARRYQMYNLWQRRIRVLHRFLIAPALVDGSELAPETRERKLNELAVDLGRTTPALSLPAALGYRIRRNYGPLVTLVLLTWTLKLFVHPTPARSLAEYVGRAGVGLVPGPIIMFLVSLFFATLVYLAVRAPSEQMKEWRELPAPIDRIMPAGIRLPGAERRSAPEGALRPESPGGHEGSAAEDAGDRGGDAEGSTGRRTGP